MGHSQYDDAGRERAAWSAGKKLGTKRPLTQKHIWAVRFFLDHERRVRDRALFDLAIDSKLRGCDLIKIRIRDLVVGLEIRTRAIVVQQKTGRPVQAQAGILVVFERRMARPLGCARDPGRKVAIGVQGAAQNTGQPHNIIGLRDHAVADIALGH